MGRNRALIYVRAWPVVILLPWCFGHVGGCGHDVVGAEEMTQETFTLGPDETAEAYVHLELDGPSDVEVDVVWTFEVQALAGGRIAVIVDDTRFPPSSEGVAHQIAATCRGPCEREIRVTLHTPEDETDLSTWRLAVRGRSACTECGDALPIVRVNVHFHP